MDVYEKLKKLDIELGSSPEKGGVYESCKKFSKNLVYISGCGPQVDGKCKKLGRLGTDITIEEGQEAAKLTALNILSIIHEQLGGLNKVKRIVKLLGFVSCSDNFYEHPQVINSASQLFIDVFGEEIGCAARSAIGVASLPGNIPVEIEALLELY